MVALTLTSAWILGLFMCLSLIMFPNYYKNPKTFLWIRIVLVLFLLFTNIQRTYFLHIKENGWSNPADYFVLYFCTLSAWAAIAVLIWPKKIILDCFFPFMFMGPIVTFIFPTETPPVWDVNYYTFFFGHGCTLFATLYVYLYNMTGYKFSKEALIRSAVTGLSVTFAVEVFNLYFGTEYIVGEIAITFEIQDWSRPLLLLTTLVSGILFVGLGWIFLYCVKPIYDFEKQEKMRVTYWDKLVSKIKNRWNPDDTSTIEKNKD